MLPLCFTSPVFPLPACEAKVNFSIMRLHWHAWSRFSGLFWNCILKWRFLAFTSNKNNCLLLTPSTRPHHSQDLPGQCSICTGRYHSDIAAGLTGIGIHILCWWSDTQCPIFSNVKTSTWRVCKGRNKWTKRLKRSLTNLWWCKNNSQASCNSQSWKI